MAEPTTPYFSKPWYQVAGWGFFFTVGTASILSFVYFHELGFFHSYEIPTEFIHVDLMYAVQYIPGFCISLALIILILHILGCKIIPGGHVYRVTHRTVALLGIGMILALGAGFTVGARTPFLIVLMFAARAMFPYSSEVEKTSVYDFDRFNMKHALSAALIIYILCCAISFWLGFFERISRNQKVFKKIGTEQVLMRRYDDMAIYCVPDTSKNTINDQLIIISRGGKADTLIWVRQ